MWSFREARENELRRTIMTFGAGALGGLAIGVLLVGRSRRAARALAGDLRDRVGEAASRIAPEWIAEDAELSALEEAVLDAFLKHEILSERGIDVGGVSHGIIELSGTVFTEEEAALAVRVASAVSGVQTVVNRLEVEEEARLREETRRRFEAGDPALTETRWEGRIVGMGRPRQGPQTEPNRPDDSQRQIERALEQADRADWQSEDLAAQTPRTDARPEAERPGQQPDYGEDELDHQDPHGGHAARTLDEQPQELHADVRSGEGLKPGTELRLEDADVPLEPHSDVGGRGPETDRT
jgi:hypothetical protein